jgi:Flp pilus assembly protein TadD
LTPSRRALGAARGLVCLLAALVASCDRAPDVPALPQVELSGYTPEVREQISQALARAAERPDDAAASGELGMILHAYGLFDAAAACYARARTADPHEARWAYYDGLVLAQRGRSAEALDALLRATSLAPRAREAQLELARQLRTADRLEESRARLAALTADLPDDPEVQFELGRTLSALGAWSDAVPHLERALALAGDRGDVHHALALAYRELGDDARAATHRAARERHAGRLLVALTALPPEVARFDLGLQRAIAAERGRRLAIAGDYAGALALVDERTRDAPWAQYALALRYAHTGQALAARPLLERARSRALEANDRQLAAAIDAELRRGAEAMRP